MLITTHACVMAAMLAAPLVQEPPAKPADTQATPQITISIADTAAPPEWELSVPVDAKIAQDVNAGRLSLRLVYPSKPLKFVRVRPTDTLKNAGFGVKADAPRPSTSKPAATTKPAPSGKAAPDASSVTLTFEPAGAEAKRLPTGRLAIVVFKVATDAEEKSYDVQAEDVAAWGVGAEAAKLAAAAGKPAIFVVTPPGLPIFGCFFYMH